MSTQTLASVTLQTIENYRTAAEKTVAAYRYGGHRLVGFFDGAIEKQVYARTARVAPRTTDRMNAMRDTVAGTVVKGIDEVADRAVKLVDYGTDTAATQVAKMADMAAGVDNTLLANGLFTAARITLPGAKVALAVSTTVARGAAKLADVAGAEEARPVRRAAAGAQKRVRRAAKEAAASVKPAARRARKAVEAVAEEVQVAAKPRRVRAPKKAAPADAPSA